MLTGHSEKRRVTVARDAGVTEFLAKPISAKGLYQRILNVVANPRPFIKTKTYFGPDRRRNTSNAYIGPERRVGGEVEVLSSPRCSTRPAPSSSARPAKETIMANDKRDIEIKTFADHHVITQPNPLRKVLRRVADDGSRRSRGARGKGACRPVRRIQELDGSRGRPALGRPCRILKDGFTNATREELFRAAHDIKGDAATFGYPSAGAAAESLCRIIEHAPDLDEVPSDLIAHHINAIQAIVRERTKLDTVSAWRAN